MEVLDQTGALQWGRLLAALERRRPLAAVAAQAVPHKARMPLLARTRLDSVLAAAVAAAYIIAALQNLEALAALAFPAS